MNKYVCKSLFAAAAFGSMIVPLNAKEHEEQEVQADQTLPYVSSSWVNQGGSTMSFTVAWSNTYANCSSVTGWTGYYSYTDSRIHTDWNLSYRDSAGNPMIASGSDIFTLVQTKKLGSPFIEE